MTKYMEYFRDMIENNQDQFASFEKLHKLYEQEPAKYQEEFNQEGEKVLSVVRKYENMLCGRSEGTGYGRYSANLSEKFWTTLRAKFPKIDFVGMN